MTESAAAPPAPPAEEEYAWDFTPESPLNGPEPIVATLIGDPGVGKTHIAMTFPRPLAIFDSEARARTVARKFRDVYIKTPRDYGELKAGVMYAARKWIKTPGTIVIDSASDLRDSIEEWVIAAINKSNQKVHPKFHWGVVYEELSTMLAFLRGRGWCVVFTARLGDVFENDLKTGKREPNSFIANKVEYHSDVVVQLDRSEGLVKGKVKKNGSKRIGYYRTLLDGDELSFDGFMKEWNAPETKPLEQLTSSSLKPAAGAHATALPTQPAVGAAPPAPAVKLHSSDVPFYPERKDGGAQATFAPAAAPVVLPPAPVTPKAPAPPAPAPAPAAPAPAAPAAPPPPAKSWKASEEDIKTFTLMGVKSGMTPDEKKAFPKAVIGKDLTSWADVSKADFDKMIEAMQVRIDLVDNAARLGAAAKDIDKVEKEKEAEAAKAAEAARKVAHQEMVALLEDTFLNRVTKLEELGLEKTGKETEKLSDEDTVVIGRKWAKALIAKDAPAARESSAILAKAGWMPRPGAALPDEIHRIERAFESLGMVVATGWAKAKENRLCTEKGQLTQAQSKVLLASLEKAIATKAAAAAAEEDKKRAKK